MPRKTYILDTNVLLHDPEAIEQFEGNDVVIPLIVLEELDKMKHYSDELGKNARHVIRYIDGIIKGADLKVGIKLGNDIALRIVVDTTNGEKKAFPLTLDRSKNKVLLIAHHLLENGEDVVIVSKDFVVRVKAQAIGIEAQDYESLKNPLENVYKGMIERELDKESVNKFYVEGKIDLPLDRPFYPNEFCHVKSGEETSLIAKFDKKTNLFKMVEPLTRDIWGIKPLNTEQRCALDLLMRDEIKLVTLIGQAGTGKTLLALACGMRKIFDESVYSRMLISRPIMPLGKDIGYLPGSKEEKLYHWMQPIFDNLKFLCEETSGGEDIGQETKNWILESNKIEMEAVTYIRGRSLSKMYIIIDEAQNLTPHEVKTVISRAGHGTKIILTGDPTQIDNPYLDKDSNALTYIVDRFKGQSIFGHMYLERTERSQLAALAAQIL
ncbi:MAG: PhoH family protein [Simkaniaceae bacterium]|nr:PhoH family protein [Simkaniaceae bacterium]MCF7852379.1 PhoH family protein [Simkaniaceae bacterium]